MRTPILLVLLTGCLSEAGFPDAVAEQVCDRWRSCDLEGLQAAYGDDDICRASIEDSMDEISSSADALDCAWDRGRARSCLHRIEEPGCDERIDLAVILDDCSAAWGCAD